MICYASVRRCIAAGIFALFSFLRYMTVQLNGWPCGLMYRYQVRFEYFNGDGDQYDAEEFPDNSDAGRA